MKTKKEREEITKASFLWFKNCVIMPPPIKNTKMKTGIQLWGGDFNEGRKTKKDQKPKKGVGAQGPNMGAKIGQNPGVCPPKKKLFWIQKKVVFFPG